MKSSLNMKFALKVCMEVLQVHPTLSGSNYQNLACSPVSIWAALSVLVAGSKGPTLEQLLRVMEHNSGEEVSDMASRLAEVLNEDYDDNDEGAPDILYASALWVAHPLTLKHDFNKLLRDVYKTEATTLDFCNQVDQVVNEANLWAEKQSKGLIKQILSRNCVTRNTVMILANALFFKGVWANIFEPENTRDKDFHLLNGNKVRVPFMKMQDTWFHYGTIEGCNILKIPYRQSEAMEEKNQYFCMYILLPENKDGLPGLVQSIKLDDNLFNNRFDYVRVKKLHIPKFDFECSVSLPKTMENLGLTHIFDKDCPDLIKMVESPGNDNHALYVSEIHHKCRVEINKKRSEVTAVTTVEHAW